MAVTKQQIKNLTCRPLDYKRIQKTTNLKKFNK